MARGEHLLPQYDYEVSTASGTDKYRLPSRAAFNRIREVVIEDSAGNVVNLTSTKADDIVVGLFDAILNNDEFAARVEELFRLIAVEKGATLKP